MGLPARLLNLFRRGRLSRDLDEELRFHLEERVDDLTTAGMSEADARREARRQFGNLAAYKERTRERDLLAGVEFVGQDLRHALRALQHAPAFTVTALVTLALAIGANTAVFSVVNGVLLNALPVPHPEDLRIMRWSGLGPRIGMFSGTSDHGLSGVAGLRDGGDAFSYPLYQGLRRAAAADADVFGYYQLRGVTTRGRHEAVVDDGLIVTESFFEGLAISPLLGRPLTASDDIDGAPPAVVISHALWTTQFDQDPAVIGQHVSLDRRPFDVVGVLPADFHGPGFDTPVAFYVPMSARGQLAPNWTSVSSSDTWWLHLMARLRRDGNEQRLQSAVTNTFAALTADVMQAPRVEIADGRAGLATDRQRYTQPLAILMSVVVIVLMIAATNLAGLSIARAAARQHEWSIRAALGGGRWRIIRQSLAESAILAVAGGALGLLVAVWSRGLLWRLLAGTREGLPYRFPLDPTVLAFTAGLTIGTAVLSGFVPAFRAARMDPAAGMRPRGVAGMPRLVGGRALVAIQITLATVLIAGAAFYVRTLTNLTRIDPGFRIDHLLLFRLDPSAAGLSDDEAVEFFDQVQTAIARIPGAQSVAVSHYKLLGRVMSGGGFFTLPARPDLSGTSNPRAYRLDVSETFFGTMGIPLVLGRGLAAKDTAAATKVVVVNETFVHRYLPDRYPIGQTLTINDEPWSIVGVSSDAKYTGLRDPIPPTVYFSYRQSRHGSAYIAVRTTPAPLTLADSARQVVMALNPDVPLTDITTEANVRDQNLGREALFATLVGGLSILAVLLACIGLYGLVAYNLTRRRREIGVRIALGATPGMMARSVLSEALWLGGLGAGAGAFGALALVRFIRSQLYGVAPGDPWTLASAAALALAAAIVATIVPARRAAMVDPVSTLRSD